MKLYTEKDLKKAFDCMDRSISFKQFRKVNKITASDFLKFSEKEVRELYENYKTKPLFCGEDIYLLEQLFNLK
jgi:hypothetical protein